MTDRSTVNKASIDEQITFIKEWNYNIDYIDIQTEALCKIALENSIWSFYYIKKQYRTENIEHFCLNLLFNHEFSYVVSFLDRFAFKYKSSLKLIEMYKLLK